MADVVVAADESGNYDFSRGASASRYLILCTVTAPDFSFGDRLLALRRSLAFRGLHLESGFHAAPDPQAIRNEVFRVLPDLDVRVDATVLEKSKAEPHLHWRPQLYRMAWYIHFTYVAPRVMQRDDRLLVVAASMGTNRDRGAFLMAVQDVVRQSVGSTRSTVAFWRDESEPCLWAADYFAWALSRKWERGDLRSYDVIKHLVRSEFDAWLPGTTHYF